jgi:cytochrome P450
LTVGAPISSPAIPSHVPPERVVDVDIYRMPGSDVDAHAGWKQLQDSSPRSLWWTPRNGGHWIVTRGRDIADIYADHDHFSSRITIVPREFGEQFPLRPTTLDPPEHRLYRRYLTTALSSGIVRQVEPTIRELASAAAERVRPRGHGDAIADFAAGIPLSLFLHLANRPETDAASLPRYAEDPSDYADSPTTTPVMQRYADYLRACIVERQQQPGADLISVLITHTIDGRRLTVDEAVDVAVALMTGGIDTVISQLGFLLIFLARHPEHRHQLVADPTRLRGAVAEMLRRFPIMTKARLVRQDRVVDGVTIRAGDMIVLPPLHGLDDREFERPMVVDFDRAPAVHSAFGNGVHRCPGASLASLELEIALHEWLIRIPDFEIDPDRPPQMRGGILNAVLSAGLRWDPAATRAAGACSPA